MLFQLQAYWSKKNEQLFIKGSSGSGKTTLLSLIGGILKPDAGTITVLNTNTNLLSSAQRDIFRADHIGFIFQQFNLLPFLSVLDNVTLPCYFSTSRKKNAIQTHGNIDNAVRYLLNELELFDKDILSTKANQLSVGQQQRIAVARALIGSPSIIIADEPTSALDSDTQTSFLELLFKQCASSNSTLIFVSHNAQLQTLFSRSISLNEINHTTHSNTSC